MRVASHILSRFAFLLPRRQQPLFLPVELLHLGGDLFHQVLAATGGHERDGAIAIALPRQLDAAADDIDPRADKRLDPVQPRLLRGIVGSRLRRLSKRPGTLAMAASTGFR